MSGIVGHIVYAALAAQVARRRGSPAAPVINRHFTTYLAGAYLGCDIQTMPEAVCVDTGREVGYGTVPLDRSPLTGGPVRPYTIVHDGRRYTPYDIHRLFYGRSHLTFGWQEDESRLAVPWDALPEYCGAVASDCASQGGSRALAYALGWMTHVAGDSLIKSVQPGLSLRLLDGTYTPRNRPVQDLYACHRVGREELGLDWPPLLDAVAACAVEPIQAHAMRIGPPAGRLADAFPDGWRPELRELLLAVLAENRRYLTVHIRDVLADMALDETADGPRCGKALSEQAGGLSFQQMMRAADEASLRGALHAIAERAAGLMDAALAKKDALA